MNLHSLLRSTSIIAVSVSSYAAQAQLVDCNAFLSGRYIQAGISPNGAFGTSTTAPAGYFANAGIGSLIRVTQRR